MSIVDQVRAPRRSDASEPQPRHLRVVAHDRTHIRRRIVGATVLSIVFLILFATVAFHVHLVKEQQRIDDLNRSAQAAQTTYDHLRLRLDTLSAPERIVGKARALGMVEANDPVWISPGVRQAPVQPETSAEQIDGYLDVKPYLQETP